MLAKGAQAWGALLKSPNDDYTQYKISDPLQEGGSGSVHHLLPRTVPPLVAKLYKPETIARIRTDKKFMQRIVVLAAHREELIKDLPFATWPRRLLFTEKEPRSVQQSLIGFTMAQLVGTTSLTELFFHEPARVRLTPDHTVHIATVLADQVARLHRHPWGFVVGDLSPNNVHVSHDFNHIHLIDTDAFQFDYNNGAYAFELSGLTPSYKSPGAEAAMSITGRVTATHDDFVLAILIFMLLMMNAGYPVHPFNALDHTEDELIENRAFPFDDPQRFPVNPAILQTYRTLPDEVRAAFTTAFTQRKPVPAANWTGILTQSRRLLRRH